MKRITSILICILCVTMIISTVAFAAIDNNSAELLDTEITGEKEELSTFSAEIINKVFTDTYYTDESSIKSKIADGIHPNAEAYTDTIVPIGTLKYDLLENEGIDAFLADVESGSTLLEMHNDSGEYFVLADYDDGDQVTTGSAIVNADGEMLQIALDDDGKLFQYDMSKVTNNLKRKISRSTINLDLKSITAQHMFITGYAQGMLIHDGTNELYYLNDCAGSLKPNQLYTLKEIAADIAANRDIIVLPYIEPVYDENGLQIVEVGGRMHASDYEANWVLTFVLGSFSLLAAFAFIMYRRNTRVDKV